MAASKVTTKAAKVPRSRLTRDDRRDQLLEAAAEILATRGVQGLTMEGLAEQAGVSKALPYSHFENSDGVLVALYEREIVGMGERVLKAQQSHATPEAQLEASIHAYFEVVRERGAVLAVLTGPGSAIPKLAQSDESVGRTFVAGLLSDTYGLRGKTAEVLADVLQGALAGAVTSWVSGTASRATAERVVTAFALAGIGDAASHQR